MLPQSNKIKTLFRSMCVWTQWAHKLNWRHFHWKMLFYFGVCLRWVLRPFSASLFVLRFVFFASTELLTVYPIHAPYEYRTMRICVNYLLAAYKYEIRFVLIDNRQHRRNADTFVYVCRCAPDDCWARARLKYEN